MNVLRTERKWRGRVFIGMTLDGFIARENDDIAWLTDPPAGKHTKTQHKDNTVTWSEFYPAVSHIVIGRGTYEKVLTFNAWPYADKHVIVISTTLNNPSHGVVIVKSLEEATAELERTHAQDVYVDGGKVIQSFLRAHLIDEITVGIAPVLIGEGLPLFGSLDKDCWLDLVATNSSESGMIHATYSVRFK